MRSQPGLLLPDLHAAGERAVPDGMTMTTTEGTMGHRVSICTARPGTWPAGVIDYEPVGSGWLTTEHAASSYGQPVLVVDGTAFGPADAAGRGWIIATHEVEMCQYPELCAAWRAAEVRG